MQKLNYQKLFFISFIAALLFIGYLCLRENKTVTEVSAVNDCVSGGGVTCTKTIYGQYTINTYTLSGTTTGSTTWTVPTGVTQVQYLVVGGGGGGGRYGGGGGGGGVRSGTGFAVSGTLTVQVGAGGLGWVGDAQHGGVAGTGGNSIFGPTITAAGGGGGGNYGNTDCSGGAVGGSGGGGGTSSGTATCNGGAGNTPSTTPVQGYAGGNGGQNYSTNHGGGGGGAGAVGATYSTGQGGVGVASSITGVSTYYGGGGSGFVHGTGSLAGGNGGGGYGFSPATTDSNLKDGTNGLGGGGGGTADNSPSLRGGNGGSGVVIIRYLTPASQQWLPNFADRKPITITNPAASDVTNYQILIPVTWNSNMQADFDDIRFTSQDGVTQLSYWLESKVDSTSARFWVKIPAIVASSSATIYMYYGNSSAVSLSSGTNTFLAYADFDTDEGFTIVDAGTTRAYGVTGTYVGTANHRVDFINLPSNTQTYIYKDYGASYFGNVIVEYNGMITGHGSASLSLAGLADTVGATPYTNGVFGCSADYVNDMTLYEWTGGTSGYVSPYIQTQENVNFYVRLTVVPSSSQTTIGVYSNSAMTTPFTNAGWTNPATHASPSASLRYFYPLSSFGNSVSGRSITGWYDNFRVRKYLANPPTAGAAGAEQSLGASSNFTVKKNEGCSCISNDDCYSGACYAGACGIIGVPGGQNLTATTEDYVANNSQYYCDKYFDGSNVLQTGGDGQIAMSFGYTDTNSYANIAFYKVAVGTTSNIAAASFTTDWITATGAVGTTVTYTGTSVKLSPSAPLYQLAYGDGTNRPAYYWWIKVKNNFGGESDWIQAPSTFMTPKKHYPIVRVVSNKAVVEANTNIQYCSGTDLSNQGVPASRDSCYPVCWTGTAGSAVVDPTNSNWKCSVCYNSSGTPVSCSTLNDGATTFTWIFPSSANPTLVTGTVNSANPVVKFGKNLDDQKVGLKITGSVCGNESGAFDILVKTPTWTEISPF